MLVSQMVCSVYVEIMLITMPAASLMNVLFHVLEIFHRYAEAGKKHQCICQVAIIVVMFVFMPMDRMLDELVHNLRTWSQVLVLGFNPCLSPEISINL